MKNILEIELAIFIKLMASDGNVLELTLFAQPETRHAASAAWTERRAAWQTQLKHQETSRNIKKHQETSRNIKKHQETSRNIKVENSKNTEEKHPQKKTIRNLPVHVRWHTTAARILTKPNHHPIGICHSRDSTDVSHSKTKGCQRTRAASWQPFYGLDQFLETIETIETICRSNGFNTFSKISRC